MRPYTQDEHIAGLVLKHGMGSAHEGYKLEPVSWPAMALPPIAVGLPCIGYFILMDDNGYPVRNAMVALNKES